MTEFGVSYFGVRRPVHVARDMSTLAEQGFTYVVHLMTEHDLDNYRTTMSDVVRVTHDAGLGVWLDPVAIGHIFGGTEFPSELAMLRPELAQRDDLGRPLPSACPSQPAVRGIFHDWIDAAVEAGADSLFWDEPHLWIGSWYDQPDRSACYCDRCQGAYEAIEGQSMPIDARDPALVAFRRELLLDFLHDLLTHARHQGVRNAMTLLPAEIDADAGLRFEDVASTGLVDDLGTDPYPFPSYAGQPDFGDRWQPFVRAHAERTIAATRANGLAAHLWVQGFSVPRNDHGYLAGAFELARDLGIGNIAVWGFDGHRDMSRFACEDPDAAWATILAGIAASGSPTS
jgi:hypothetical protein